MEESGKEALKFSMNCGIAVSVGTLCKINNQFCVIQLCYTVPSSLHCASVMKFWSYIQCHILNENRAISPLRLSLMMSLAIFRIPSSQAMETPEAFNHLHI